MLLFLSTSVFRSATSKHNKRQVSIAVRTSFHFPYMILNCISFIFLSQNVPSRQAPLSLQESRELAHCPLRGGVGASRLLASDSLIVFDGPAWYDFQHHPDFPQKPISSHTEQELDTAQALDSHISDAPRGAAVITSTASLHATRPALQSMICPSCITCICGQWSRIPCLDESVALLVLLLAYKRPPGRQCLIPGSGIRLALSFRFSHTSQNQKNISTMASIG